MKTLIQAAVVTLFASSAAQAQQAVQWRVADGGNGHWYARNPSSLTWLAASKIATSAGATLATTTTSQELGFIRARLITDGATCWLGGTIDCSSTQGACCQGCVWRWTTGETFNLSWAGWTGDNAFNTERLVTNGVAFDDMCSPCSVQDFRPPSIVEWSADCNGDGIVDYGQILNGQFDDFNRNGIPDRVCECIGDLDVDGDVAGADLGLVLAAWGSAVPGTAADLNADGAVDGFDLAVLLAGWGPCTN